ncbi:MAG: hypothetical protein U0T81_04775 [Saprospiraceae bacterium]
MKHLRRAMEKDAIAIMNTLMWLEDQHANGQFPTEFELSQQADNARSQLILRQSKKPMLLSDITQTGQSFIIAQRSEVLPKSVHQVYYFDSGDVS